MDDRATTALRVLGSLEVVRDGEPVRFGSPQQRRLLAVLVVHANEVVSSDRLVDVLWGDDPPASAAHSLQTLLSRLRATLGDDRLEPRPPGYRLRVASGDVDALRFEELVRVGLGAAQRSEVALGVFDDALGLWRGSPYGEFASEEFATAEVARLLELRARAMEERSAALLELGRPEDVIGELEAEIVVEPFRERLRALLMLALARAGRPVESLRAYDAFRRFLADEVGVLPSPGLQELNDDIVRQHPDVSWAGSPTKDPDTTALPSGTVTFLFTDIEGSTRLWEEHPDAMRDALARHDEIVRSAIESHRGQVVKTSGDGFHAAFSAVHDGVEAAIDAQRSLGTESWDATGPLLVRMGVHTGEVQLRDGDYYGTAVNRAARVMAVAHGGQLLVSDATERLLGDAAGDSFEMVDLGEHRLRDLAQASRVFQVVAPGLSSEFPPLRSMEAFPGNLPVQLTSFVGRDDESVALPKLMSQSRLVTLTGAGGVGKTRLALQVAAELAPRFSDGVWLCELATASDEELMFQAVADAVGARQREGMSMGASVVEYLRNREVLVVLDNCEHLLSDAACLVGSLLQRCPQVRVLATSREGLGVAGEQLVALASLSVPPASADLAAMSASEAIWLFVDRATAVRSGFTLGPANIASVAEICRRVDGMPLAIELAAARVTAMSPAEIATRLDERFRLLTGGKRSRVERHQTLRATVEWSYSLLSAKERSVFARLGVFVGSFDAAAAEAVVTDDDVETWDVLECLAGLVEKSMLLAEDTDDGTTRYRLLETLRAFAREQLDTAHETDRWRRRHAEHYAEFCERAGPELRGVDELLWARRIEPDLDNIRAVLRWGSDAPAQTDADFALRIVIALARGAVHDRWDLAQWAGPLVPRARTSALAGRGAVLTQAAGWDMLHHDDLESAERLAREALDLVTDPRAIERSYFVLGSARYRQGRTAEALELLDEGHQALEAADAPRDCHGSLYGNASLFHMSLGDREAARRAADTQLDIARAAANPSMLVFALANSGRAWFSEDPDAALAAFEESIALTRGGAADGCYTQALGDAAQLRARRGERVNALALLRTAIAHDHDVGIRANLGLTVERAIAILARLGDDELAALCSGVVQSGRITSFRALPQADRTAARVADRMNAHAYQTAFAQGAALTYQDVGPALLAQFDRVISETTEA